MKSIFPSVLFTVLYGSAMEASAAPICGSWNNYENCVNKTYHGGIDQGTIAKDHRNNFVNHILPNFQKYTAEQAQTNDFMQQSFENEINVINRYFVEYAKGVKAWKTESPGSFYDYFRTHDERQALISKWNQFEKTITNLYNETYNLYVDLFIKLNKAAVESIYFNYWTKAYFPAISGVWGFQPAYYNSSSHDVFKYLSFITRGGNDKSYSAVNFTDYWNNAATQPTTRTDRNTVYVQVNNEDLNRRKNTLYENFLNVRTDNTPYKDQIPYVMEFESKLLQVLTLDSLDDKTTKRFFYGMSYVDHHSKEDLFNDVFYATKNYAESNAISLVYGYVVNRHNQDYLSKLQKQLEKVKTFTWYNNASERYKQIIDGILANNDSPVNIVVDSKYINYVIDNNKMQLKGWAGDRIEKGDIRSYVNRYHDHQLEVLKAKRTANFAGNNIYFPTEQNSNGDWQFVGVIFDKYKYRDFIKSVSYKAWRENTFPGDIHKSDGRYFSPKFSGNPSDGNRTYPSGRDSNENWLYLGDDDRPSDGMYSYIIYSRFYHDLYSQMLKLWQYSLQNHDLFYNMDIDIPLQQLNTINKTLTSVMDHSQKSWRYATYAPVEASLLVEANADIRMEVQLWMDFMRMLDEEMPRLMELPEVEGDIPHYTEVLEKWATDQWDPPDEFVESWYPRATDRFGDNLEPMKEFLERIDEQLAEGEIEGLIATFSNANLVSLVNAMGITSSLAVVTETVVTTSALASIFSIFF